VFGASGLLGKYLMREWSPADHVVGLNSGNADIRYAAQVRAAVEEVQPDWIVLAAAYTDVDGCETNPDLAMAVNYHGALNVANVARDQKCKLLFTSSDYVFDGMNSTPYEIDDRVNPQSVYGRSKAEAERGIRELVPSACILRTSWVFGVGGKCFPDTILKLAASRDELFVVNDQRGSPTYTRDLARTVAELTRRGATGTVHATNRGTCTWYEFAAEIIRQSGLSTMVSPTTTDRFPRPAKRPLFSVLSTQSLDSYGIVMPSWQEAVRNYLSELSKVEVAHEKTGRP
jgi:dTDP-4-dehydrorhamnose reductase